MNDIDQPMSAGTHAATWDASGLPSGTYLYRLTAGPFSQTWPDDFMYEESKEASRVLCEH